MSMPKLGTMRLRSEFYSARAAGYSILLAVVLLFQSAGAQVAPVQPSGTQNVPPAQNQTPSAQSPPAQAPATQGGNQAGATQPPGQSAPAEGSSPQQQTGSQGQGDTQVPATDNGVFVFHAEAREVTLHATVVDDHNRLITNLDKADFAVFENNQPQQIRSFRQEDIPVAIGIVIDNSGSMRDKRSEVNKAAINLVRASNPDDQVFVVNFSDEYYLDQEFTSDIKKLQAALERVESRGGTALYDAIIASADYLMKSPLQRKILFVVTDGEDDASQTSLEQAVRRLQQENGPTVYTIGLLSEDRRRKAKRALEVVADRTGGIAFFPPTLAEVDQISQNIARDIRNQYTITYTPTTPKDVGGYRTIHVDAHARAYKKLTVRTRSGYYPGQEQGAGGSN